MKRRLRRGKASSIVLRCFKCPECGLKMVAPKGRGSEPSHKKDMYCPFCKDVTKFVLFDSDRIFNK